MSAGFPGGALVPDLVNHSHQMFASHQGDSLRELASVAVDNPMTTEGLVDPSGDHSCDAMQCIQHWLGRSIGVCTRVVNCTVMAGNSWSWKAGPIHFSPTATECLRHCTKLQLDSHIIFTALCNHLALAVHVPGSAYSLEPTL